MLVIWYKRKYTNYGPFPFKIIAVGNLTVGGTGKSVVVPFLARLLGEQKSAIILRGYKGLAENTSSATCVSDGHRIFVNERICGDEAMMYAKELRSTVVVNRNRAKACRLVQQRLGYVEYVILDDAYQNYDVKKDLEILLLDARAPFDNGHCLPAGRLREKDYTRTDAIILTHADAVSLLHREFIKKNLLKKVSPEQIFMGAHVCDGVYHLNRTRCQSPVHCDKKVLVVASVGSFDGVVTSIQNAGFAVGATKKYRDHYCYSADDVKVLLKFMHDHACEAIVTTAKDWVKLEPLLCMHQDWQQLPIFVIRVAFEFLSMQEYDSFVALMKRKLRTT